MKQTTKFLLLALMMPAFAFAVPPKRIIVRGGTPTPAGVLYNVVKQKGSGSNLVLKCLNAGVNACVITRYADDYDNVGNVIYNDPNDLSDYDMAQYNFGIDYAHGQIYAASPVSSGSYTWTTQLPDNTLISYVVSWSPLTEDPEGDFEILVSRIDD